VNGKSKWGKPLSDLADAELGFKADEDTPLSKNGEERSNMRRDGRKRILRYRFLKVHHASKKIVRGGQDKSYALPTEDKERRKKLKKNTKGKKRKCPIICCGVQQVGV